MKNAREIIQKKEVEGEIFNKDKKKIFFLLNYLKTFTKKN